MKYIRLLIIGAAMALAGCANLPKIDLTGALTFNTIAGAESAYGVALTAMRAYKKRPLCFTGTVSTLDKPCARRSSVVKMQAANAIAISAIRNAVKFVEANPTVDATNYISAAITAVNDFKSIIAGVN